MYVHICMHIYVYIHTYTYLYVHVNLHIYIHKFIFCPICIHIFIYSHIYMHLEVIKSRMHEMPVRILPINASITKHHIIEAARLTTSKTCAVCEGCEKSRTYSTAWHDRKYILTPYTMVCVTIHHAGPAGLFFWIHSHDTLQHIATHCIKLH